jgi:hypothetical protein
MTIKSSGSSLAISEIAAEFGGSTPHSLSEYYRGGSLVPSASSTSGIASSGAITMSSFYGTSNRIAITLTISGDTSNYNIYNNRGGTYVAGLSDVTLVNNATISSTSTGTAALDTGTGWTSGDVITIDNNSTIVGDGGDGGTGSTRNNNTVTSAATAGGAGGHAINIQFDTTIDNTGGTLSGGGGGGGGSGGATATASAKGSTIYHTAGGNGGGGGFGGGAGGAAGSASSNNSATNGNAGAAGSVSAVGSGGAAFSVSVGSESATSAAGGDGGGAGAAGTTVSGAGGAAGKAVNLNGNTVTFTATGTRNGATS